MFKLSHYSKELSSHDTIEDALKALCGIEDNPHWALANGGYSIKNEAGEVQDVSHELKTEIEKAIRKAECEKIIAKIHEIAAALGFLADIPDGYFNSNGYYYPNNVRATLKKGRISFSISRQYTKQKRFVFSVDNPFRDKDGRYLSYLDYNEARPECTFAADRDTAAIVKVVKKKWYPIIEEHYTRQVEALEKVNSWHDREWEGLQLVKGKALTDQEKKSKQLHISSHVIKASGREVRFESFYTSPKKARQVLDILK